MWEAVTTTTRKLRQKAVGQGCRNKYLAGMKRSTVTLRSTVSLRVFDVLCT